MFLPRVCELSVSEHKYSFHNVLSVTFAKYNFRRRLFFSCSSFLWQTSNYCVFARNYCIFQSFFSVLLISPLLFSVFVGGKISSRLALVQSFLIWLSLYPFAPVFHPWNKRSFILLVNTSKVPLFICLSCFGQSFFSTASHRKIYTRSPWRIQLR